MMFNRTRGIFTRRPSLAHANTDPYMFDDTVSMMTLNDEDILGSNDAGVPGFKKTRFADDQNTGEYPDFPAAEALLRGRAPTRPLVEFGVTGSAGPGAYSHSRHKRGHSGSATLRGDNTGSVTCGKTDFGISHGPLKSSNAMNTYSPMSGQARPRARGMHRRSSSTGAVVHSPQPFGVPRVATATTKYYAQGPPQHPARPLGNAMTVPAQPHLSLPPVTYTDSSPPAALFTPDSRMRVVDMKQPDQLSNTLHLVAPPVTPQQYHVVHPMGVPSYASPATLPRYQLHDPGYGSPPAAPKIKPGLPTDYSPPTVHSAVPTSHVSNGSASSGASTHASSLPSPYAFRLEETGKTVYPGRASSQTSDYDGKRPRHPGFNLPSETKEMLTRERLPSVRFARRNAEHSGIELMDALTGVNMHEQGSYTLREMHAEDRDKIDLAITWPGHRSITYAVPIDGDDGRLDLTALVRRIARAAGHFLDARDIPVSWRRLLIHNIREVSRGCWEVSLSIAG